MSKEYKCPFLFNTEDSKPVSTSQMGRWTQGCIQRGDTSSFLSTYPGKCPVNWAAWLFSNLQMGFKMIWAGRTSRSPLMQLLTVTLTSGSHAVKGNLRILSVKEIL